MCTVQQAPVADESPRSGGPKRQLTLFDSSCIIVGIIVGAGIYMTAPDVAKGAGSAAAVLALWALGGVLSLCGAICYAELATALPREGGDYVYLSRAYGRWAGFLFGWIQLVVVRPGDIVGMAFAFAAYAAALLGGGHQGAIDHRLLAAGAVVVLTAINAIGVREGKWTQNLLTVVKALGLLAVVVVAMFAQGNQAPPAAFDAMPVSVALILVLFTYGGWNEMAYVAAEVKNPDRNILRALLLGTGAVIALYLLLNVAFLYALGYNGLAASQAVATDAIATVFPQTGRRLISALICISALGALNGLIFTGARITYALGADHGAFRWLGKWDPKTGTPLRALVLQGAIAVGLILALGTFLSAVIYTAAAVYLFYLATTVAVIVLRWREPGLRRPYRVTAYPVVPLVFACTCVLLIYGAVSYKPLLSAVAAGLIVLGLPVYWVTRHFDQPPVSRSDRPADGS